MIHLGLTREQAQFLATLLAYLDLHPDARDEEQHRLDLCFLLAAAGIFPKYGAKP